MNETLKFVFQFMMKEKKLFLIGLLATLSASFCTWLSPQLLAKVIDESFAKKLILFFALSEFFKLVLSYLTQKTFARFGQNIIERIREAMIDHLMKVPVSYFDRSSSGQIMTRVVNDVNSLTDFFQSGLISIVGNGASVVAIFVGLFSLNFNLALFLLLVFLPFAYACMIFSRKLRVAYEETRNELSHFNSMLADFLFGMKTIRSLSLTKQKDAVLTGQIDKYSSAQVKMVKTFALFNPVLSLGIGMLFFVLILKGIPMVDQGTMKTGEWVAVLSYIFSLQQPLMEMTDRWNFFLGGLTSIDRIRNVFSETLEKTGELKPEKLKRIELKNVSFQYHSGTKKVLSDANLVIHAGDRIGVFGETGMGKTTLLQLLYGFYHPTQGEIAWNSNSISYDQYCISDIRNYFGVVEQFPLLFSGSVKENVSLFGQFDFDPEKLKIKFKKYPLISSILNRLNEEVRERGSNFSMGEKQMISFMRAYLKQPQIWILDEATAFFDPEAEKEFMDALATLGSEIVIVQIAHRKEALEQMHRLLKVEQGQVLEQLK
jgi:ATP-binding cassette subfamily B protein